jgi:triacylglycerol lipase
VTRQTTFLLYRWLHSQAGGAATARLPQPTADQRDALRRMLGSLPRTDDNDGVVPTYSQLWGEVLYAARADHLDVIGHFHDEHHVPPHHDWIFTGSGFDRRGFEALWNAVIAYMVPERRRWWRLG